MDLEQRVAGVAALADPVRRSLYLYVAGEHRDVSRDEAAAAVGVTRGLAAFHLDKLIEEGLLEARYRRLTGRTGPGAGRPSKLYRRSTRQLSVSLPPRSYELAAKLFARALSDPGSDDATATLHEAARAFGERLGDEARRATVGADCETQLEAMNRVLGAHGYEPHLEPDGCIRLRNCPFHALVSDYRPLVCGMNLHLMSGVLSGLRVDGVRAAIDPRPGMCCVALCTA